MLNLNDITDKDYSFIALHPVSDLRETPKEEDRFDFAGADPARIVRFLLTSLQSTDGPTDNPYCAEAWHGQGAMLGSPAGLEAAGGENLAELNFDRLWRLDPHMELRVNSDVNVTDDETRVRRLPLLRAALARHLRHAVAPPRDRIRRAPRHGGEGPEGQHGTGPVRPGPPRLQQRVTTIERPPRKDPPPFSRHFTASTTDRTVTTSSTTPPRFLSTVPSTSAEAPER